MRGLMWFREDLRILDNIALSQAANTCNDGIVGLFFIDLEMWRKHDMAPCRIEFLLRGLEQLSLELAKFNIPLLIENSTDGKNLPQKIYQIMQQVKTEKLFFNKQYELDELVRDQAVELFLDQKQTTCRSFDDQTILTPGSIVNQQGTYYKVFTAYKRAWQQHFAKQTHFHSVKKPNKQMPIDVTARSTSDIKMSFKSGINKELWPAGEKHAQAHLTQFIKKNLLNYDKTRDYPAMDSTSKLSVYLSAGMISPRTCFVAALNANQHELYSGNKGALTWMSELIWRDFYKHILVAVPKLSMHRPFKLETEKIKWKMNQAHFTAWKEGRTGFPIIDAAMRQLNTTGWMHNRLRMITAMFLTKNLFIDWRQGEKYFMTHLIDGDLAANNGGWQWCASTGTDAAPYFRIFNPVRQSERFDPDGDFIRQFCPELSHLDKKSIHQPHKYEKSFQTCQYPEPIVDLEVTRQYAIKAFKQL